MCNPIAILAWLIAGEVSTMGAVTLLLVSARVNGDLYTTATTPGFLLGALGALGFAIAQVSLAAGLLSRCTSGPCGTQASTLRSVLIALDSLIVALFAAIAVFIWWSAAPFATVTFIKLVLAIPLIAVAGLWIAAVAVFTAFVGCTGGVSGTATTIQMILAGLLALLIAAVIIYMIGDPPQKLIPA
jgi:hypothetical protein